MLLPKKVQHRKWQKGRKRQKGVATRTNRVVFGEFGIKSEEHGWISSRQIEAARRVLTHFLKRNGKVWIRIFPDRPVTKKGNEVPMGGGKGSPDHYVAVVKPGTVIFEIAGMEESVAKEAIKLTGYKLSVLTKFVKKI
ncbi:MAG: 50S ribosomal protein L16 [Patescibacteria group bacterium]|jgi:large subunit ribosomal protein L16|nr:50S ribosomal protein L16 [Patescibacteria group bacterium]